MRIALIAAIGLGLPTLTLWIVTAQPTLPTKSESPLVRVNTERLEKHVRMLSETFIPRDADSTQNLDRVAAYISRQLRDAKGSVSEQTYNIGKKTYRNVIATFGPTAGERIVVGAHYDAFHTFPGADDNASGIAGLLELARLLARDELPMRVDLAAFTLEEPPYFRTKWMGSAVHARSLKEQGVEVRAMIALEMIGCFSDERGSQGVPLPILKLFYPSRGNFIAVVGKLGQRRLTRRVKKAMQCATELPVYSINAPSIVPGIDFSDHRNYWAAGYPAVMITDTAFYRNSRYHSARDTADTLDYSRMALVVEAAHAAVLDLAREVR